MSNKKVKGLLKGLRYISQVFDNEKEQEIQIGNPTDVKHVAHVGCDGPSVDSPSWMREFSIQPSSSSGPLDQSGNAENSTTKWGSLDSSSGLKSSRPPASPGREFLEKLRPSRSHSISGPSESPIKAKTDKPKHRRPKSSSQQRDLSEVARTPRLAPQDGSESSACNHSGVPKKSRRKKTKEGGSTRSRSKADQSELAEPNKLNSHASSHSDSGPESAGSVS